MLLIFIAGIGTFVSSGTFQIDPAKGVEAVPLELITLGGMRDTGREMTKADEAAMYKSIADQASLAEAGGLAKERAVLLLWFLRNVIGIGELEAYDHVCDGDKDQGIDGLFLELGSGDDPADTLVIFQSKYFASPGGQVGPTDIDRLSGAAHYFDSSTSLSNLLSGSLEPALVRLIESLGLGTILADPAKELKVRLVLVDVGELNPEAKRKVKALNEKFGPGYIDVWNLDRLGPIALAVRSPERIQEVIQVNYVDSELLVTGEEPNRVAVLPVSAVEVTKWPGIESRQLFALNVRHELHSNRVSKALDGAIGRPDEHKSFLAYHNGLTLVCDKFEFKDGIILIHNPSVVNGAQSVLSFQRGAATGFLSEDLKVFIKVVEVKGLPTLEKEVGRRSNTQTGVNPRNLMANHGVQLRLEREFQNEYPGIVYQTRPDVITPSGKLLISNDEAAQLLCAIFNQWPELAVKKNSLFEADNYPQIFTEHIHAHHIVFANRIKEAVQIRKGDFPSAYQESWLLTRITACYLVGQVLRESGFLTDAAKSSKSVLEDERIMESLDEFAYQAAMTLDERNRSLGDADDFKKDFKNSQKLRELNGSVRKTYQLVERLNKKNLDPGR